MNGVEDEERGAAGGEELKEAHVVQEVEEIHWL